MSQHSISYVVGAEKRLVDVVAGNEVMPLLTSAVRGGASGALLIDDAGEVLWFGDTGLAKLPAAGGGVLVERRPLLLEGEPVGSLVLLGGAGREAYLRTVADLLAEALQILVNASLKRMLTTEMHTVVVNQSYEELVAINRELAASEARYRELAASLEVKVRERTEELRQTYAKLLQREKMASVGQLAAGVAHEINNPLGFITSNLHSLTKYADRLREMLEFSRLLLARDEEELARFRRKWQDLRLDFIMGDLDELLRQSLGGAERVKTIVSDLKGFSHVDDAEIMTVDVNEELDRTLNVLIHEIPPGTEIVREYRPLPPFLCAPALLCQALLNIIRNACEARREGLRLTVATAGDDHAITVRIADNGPGVPEPIRGRIFEPFFTTKEVGKGTGMGLAVVYDISNELGGSVELLSPPDGGACFVMTLPLRRS
ncbi:hypothetical protein GURASL_26400 [Geotalea uraniireducens]|uniref:histidine kinase n=1 Tax=Geotalea uraniireducens TaxID=351604 RepID=A0ABM8EMS3_9BACT|nr:ATP-binding protein [Geotalea uraniireducens]BDV43717.1 hypothetical protein GURASL_26400 [Geotalea uraniireducens]